ncbi:hypothetical protein TNCV_1726431 [Trichonephila clavipes]|nr:hypothetical protein TNCV_1726431 [Trichonephila clavipes]
MDDSMPVNVPGFDLRLYCNTSPREDKLQPSSVAVSSSCHKAGGVATYRNINHFTGYNRINIDILEINLTMAGW